MEKSQSIGKLQWRPLTGSCNEPSTTQTLTTTSQNNITYTTTSNSPSPHHNFASHQRNQPHNNNSFLQNQQNFRRTPKVASVEHPYITYKIKTRKPTKTPAPAPNIIVVKDDDRPFVKVQILDKDVIGLLDSGANISLLGKDSGTIIKASGIKVDPFPAMVQTADGKRHETKGVISLPIKYNGETRIIKCIIVPSVKHQILFGWDFWKAFGIVPYVCACDIDLVPEEKAKNTEHELTCEQRSILQDTLKKFPVATDDKIGCQKIFKHTIDTENNPPVVSTPYYYSKEVEGRLNVVIDRWLKLGIIEPVSSPWLNPLVVVMKSDGTARPCLDARKLNSITKKDKYPMPNINRILARLKKASFFCSFDLKDAFLQTELDETSKEKTSFAVPGRGQFCFKRMPFGLVNSAAGQCKLMDQVLKYDLEPNVFHYLDDIIITADTFEEMIELMSKVAERLANANLTINLKKSQVCAKQIVYLGYVISEEGISVDPTKITPILNFKTPKTVRDVRSLIGMSSWYRRFIPNFSSIIAPISDLISNGKKAIKWTPQAEEAFNNLKSALISEPVLVAPDFDREFTVQTDASDVGIGGVLTQVDAEGHEHVVSYYSKKLTKAERKYTVTERECLAVLRSIAHFRAYIELRHFNVITDHHSLTWLKNLKDPTGRLSRWALQLQHHDYTIKHRPGKQMVVPDALSRAFDASDDVEAAAIDGVEQLSWYAKMKQNVETKPDEYPDYRIEDGVLMRHIGNNRDITKTDWRTVVPNARKKEILKECHDDAAHLGYTKTYARICDRYWWPKMFNDVRQYVKKCEACGETKSPNYQMVAPMGQARIPSLPFEWISMDFKGPFVRSTSGYCYILVITDQLSKFVLLHKMRKADAKSTVKIVEDHFLLFGVPSCIIHDNGTVFVSKLFTDLLQRYMVNPMKTPLYHPQANPTERVNRVIGTAISAYVEDNHKKWDEKLSQIGSAIRTSLHESTNFTPYEIVFGMKMRTSGDEHKNNVEQSTETRVEHLKQIRNIVQENLRKAHEKSKKYYDLRTRTRQLKVNDSVYVRNFKLSNAANNYSAGIAKNWRPGIITAQTGPNSYEITGMDGKKIGNFDCKDIKVR
jgi:transposase InsO family protein